MDSQVRKNLEHPTHSLYHHGLIKMLVLAELKKQDWVWEQFVYELSNPHLQSSLGNELGEPGIPYLMEKASSANNSVHQNDYPHDPAVNSCKKPAPSHTKRSQISKGQGVSSRFGEDRDLEKLFVLPNRIFTRSMATKEGKRESKGKEPVHVELSSSNASSAHDNSGSPGSPHHSTMSSPVSEPLLPASPSKSSLKSTKASLSKSGSKSAKSHKSEASAQGIDYFRQKNFKLTKKLQEYVRLDRFIKQENAILKAKVASLQTLVDEVIGSNRSLRKQLKKKDKQFEQLVSVQQHTAPSPPQVQVMFNTSALVSGV